MRINFSKLDRESQDIIAQAWAKDLGRTDWQTVKESCLKYDAMITLVEGKPQIYADLAAEHIMEELIDNEENGPAAH